MEGLSILYDTIMYCVLYFDEDIILETDIHFLDSEKFSLFYRYKETANYEISKVLWPFFAYDLEKISLLTEYFMEKINSDNFYKYDINSFLEDILDKDSLRHHYIKFFLKTEDDDDLNLDEKYSDLETVMKRSEEIEYSDSLKLYVFNIYLSFDNLVTELVQTLKDIYEIAKRAHNENQDIINSLLKECKNDETIELLKAKSLAKKLSYDKRAAIFTVFAPTSCMILDTYDILGLEFKSMLENRDENGDIKMFPFGKIYDLFKNREEISTNELAKELCISKSTAEKYLTRMFNQEALIINRKTDTDTYYSLNEAYFKNTVIRLF
ncbi:MAG: hypothetical protein LBI03_08195 [Clostridiales bacterium]|jgi:hypothetical protein|nr:hypothetical protein [Clostridiales bacterium]